MPWIRSCSGLRPIAAVAAALGLLAPCVPGQTISGTSFTYQGRITEADQPFIGPVTIGFTLFADAIGGAALAPQQVVPNVTPDADGTFSVPLDFASGQFRDGTPRFLELAIIEAGNPPVVLSPRQAIRPAPLAVGVAGLAMTPGGNVLDVDAIYNHVGFAPVIPGGLASQRFTVFTAGTLHSVAFQPFGLDGDLLEGSIHRGPTTASPALASFSVPIQNEVPCVIPLASYNIAALPGDVFTIRLSSFAVLATVQQAWPGTAGRRESGASVNYWFQSTIASAPRVPTADHSFRSSRLLATATSSLNDLEIRLRAEDDRNHGLGWFGGSTTFRSSGIAPDGPILFGSGGGALATFDMNSNTAAVALRWNSGAQVGIGTAPSSAGYRLELPNTAAPAGQGRANAWVTYSSRAYKHNIETIRDPLGLVAQLRGVRFEWNADEVSEAPAKHDIGFIAEEIADVLPDLVSRDADGNATGLDYGRVVPVAIEAIKQQQTQIAQQQDQIKTLRDQLDRMEQRLNELGRAAR